MTLGYYRIPRCLLSYHSGAGAFSWVVVVHICVCACVCACVCVCVCACACVCVCIEPPDSPPDSKSLLIGEDPDVGKD